MQAAVVIHDSSKINYLPKLLGQYVCGKLGGSVFFMINFSRPYKSGPPTIIE